MNFWPFRKPPPVAAPAPEPPAPDPMVTIALRTQPLVLNPGAQETIDQAWYRLGAIVRHVEQAGANPDHEREHFPEVTRLCLYLNGVIGAADETIRDTMRARLRELVDRAKAVGWDPLKHMGA